MVCYYYIPEIKMGEIMVLVPPPSPSTELCSIATTNAQIKCIFDIAIQNERVLLILVKIGKTKWPMAAIL